MSRLMRLAPLLRHLGQPHTWFPLTVAALLTWDHASSPRTGWTSALVWFYGVLLMLLSGYLVRNLRALWDQSSARVERD